MMNECKLAVFFSDTGYLFAIGGFLVFVWIGLYLGSWIWAWSWAWIDDNKTSKKNPLVKYIMTKIYGYEVQEDGQVWAYRKDGSNLSDGAMAFFPFIPILFFAPFIAVKLTSLMIGGFVIVLLAHLARFARRHKKLFDAHVVDKDAHK